MKKVILLALLFHSCMMVFSHVTTDKAFNDFYRIEDDTGEYDTNVHSLDWELGQSSWLIESGKTKDFYSREKAFDGDTSTAWVEGKKGDGIGEYIYCHINSSPFWYSKFRNDHYEYMNFELSIVNGFAKNENLFHKNNRVKTIKVTIYDMETLNCKPDGTEVNDPSYHGKVIKMINKAGHPAEAISQVIELEDTMEPQTFNLRGRPQWENLYGISYGVFGCFAKIEILDVYKGTAYDDTCISEIKIKSWSGR